MNVLTRRDALRPPHRGGRQRGLRARQGLRGVAFLYFALLALPMFFLGASMATDFTTIIVSHHQESDAVQAAALAGASQYGQGLALIDEVQAKTAAIGTYCRALNDGALGLSSPVSGATPCPTGTGKYSLVISFQDETIVKGRKYAETVTVTATYQTPHLIFASVLGGDGSKTQPKISRTAAICVPGAATGKTGGFCAPPSS